MLLCVSHVIEEVVDIKEKVIFGEEIVRVHDKDEVSSHARALPKNLIASL
jgi:hypothetical protein